MISPDKSLCITKSLIIDRTRCSSPYASHIEDDYIISNSSSVWPNYAIFFSAISEEVLDLLADQIILAPKDVINQRVLKIRGFRPVGIWYSMSFLISSCESYNPIKLSLVQDEKKMKIWSDLVDDIFFKGDDDSRLGFAGMLESAKYRIFLFLVNGEVVGTALIYLADSTDAGLYFFGVKSTAQNQGLGRKFLIELEAYLNSIGIKNLTLQSTMAGRALYLKYGFVEHQKIILYTRLS